MPIVNRKCTEFRTTMDSEGLAKLILSQENRAMGSGGYAIQREKAPEKYIQLSLHNPWSSGSPQNHIFIKDSLLWATFQAGWLLDLLNRKDIDVTTRRVATPTAIENHMIRLIEEDELTRRKRA